MYPFKFRAVVLCDCFECQGSWIVIHNDDVHDDDDGRLVGINSVNSYINPWHA